jgi:hypothetical protein
MKRTRFGAISLVAVLVLSVLSIGLRPVTAYANGATPFSGYGDGTDESPYRIANCAQLQSMNDHIDATYELVSNIDCEGVEFTSIGIYNISDFTGKLFGNNHTIKNLTINGLGLFTSAKNATIKDFRIESGSITSTNTAGSIVGIAGGATLITNVHSNMDIATEGGYTGGLVGMIFGGTGSFSFTKSSFSGSVSAPVGYLGGLVGGVFLDEVVIEDSFVDGTVNPAISYSGGAIGGMFSTGAQVSRIYSSSTINFDGTQASAGGLIGGFFEGTVTDSFSASLANGIGGVGGLWGSGDNGISTNNWFDLYRIGTGNCVWGGSNTCSGATNSQAAPEVWKGDNTTTPIDTWDFNTIWQAQENDYPTLRGLQAMLVPSNVPNNGDANGDGIDDSYQAYVKSLPNDADVWSTIETPANSNCTIENPQWSNPYSSQTDTGFAPQLTTTTGFEVYCPTAGMTVPITVIYDKVYDTSKSVLRYYNPTTKNFQTVSGATFGTRSIGGVTKTTVTYNITDGGTLDSDGVANKIIKDPIMLSLITVGAPSTGLEKSTEDHNNPLAAIALVVSLSAAGFVVRKRYQ